MEKKRSSAIGLLLGPKNPAPVPIPGSGAARALAGDAGSLGLLGLPLSSSRLYSCTLSEGLDLDTPTGVMTPPATQPAFNNTAPDVFTLLLSQLHQCHNQRVTELEQSITHLRRKCRKLEDLVRGRGEVAQRYRQTCQRLKEENRTLRRYMKDHRMGTSLTPKPEVSSSQDRRKEWNHGVQDQPPQDQRVETPDPTMMSTSADSSRKSRLARRKGHKKVRYAEISPEETSRKASQRLKASIEEKLLVPETMDPDLYEGDSDQVEDGSGSDDDGDDDDGEGNRKYPLMAGEPTTSDNQPAALEEDSTTSEIFKRPNTDMAHVRKELRSEDRRMAGSPCDMKRVSVEEGLRSEDKRMASTPRDMKRVSGERRMDVDEAVVECNGYLQETSTPVYSPSRIRHQSRAMDLSPVILEGLDDTAEGEGMGTSGFTEMSPTFAGHNQVPADRRNNSPLQGLSVHQRLDNTNESEASHLLLPQKDSLIISRGGTDSLTNDGADGMKDAPAGSRDTQLLSRGTNGAVGMLDSPADGKDSRLISDERNDSPLAGRDSHTNGMDSPLTTSGFDSSLVNRDIRLNQDGRRDSSLARKAVTQRGFPAAESLKSNDMKRKISPLERRSKLARLSRAEPSGGKRGGIRREFTSHPDLSLLENQSKLRQSTLSQHLVPTSLTTAGCRAGDPFKVPAVPAKADRSTRSYNGEASLSLSLNGSVDPVIDLEEYEEGGGFASDRSRAPEEKGRPALPVTPEGPGGHEMSEAGESRDKSDLMFEDSVEDLPDENTTPPKTGIKDGYAGEMDDFDRVPRKDAGPQYKHREVVRKHDEREKLKGFDCKQCAEFYDGMGLTDTQKEDRMKACSRHRGRFTPPSTPEHYWSIDFPDTPTCVKRGYILEDVDNRVDDKAMPRRRNKLKQLFKK